MVRDGSFEARSEVLHLHHADDELRKFIDPGTERLGSSCQVGIVREQVAVEDLDHARARSGRHDDRDSRFERFEETPRELDRGFAKALVERWLPTAERAARYIDLEPESLQDGHCRIARLWKELF